MFEQTTPQSNCCLESVQVLDLGLNHLSGRMEEKLVRGAQPKMMLFVVTLCTDVTVVTGFQECSLDFSFSSCTPDYRLSLILQKSGQ